MEREEVDEEMDEEKEEEEYHEAIKLLLMALQAIVQVLNALMVIIHDDHIERPLARRPISRIGYNYIHKVLNEDPQEFRVLYRMYPDVFLKLCDIITEKTHLKGTRFICIEEMVATFLLTVGQNSRYCQTRDTFWRSHFTTSKNFNIVLKALNTIAPDLMVKPGSTVPTKIRESTRFYPYFKDSIGAIDETHIPAMVSGPEVASYRDRHGKITQNVLAACNFDLEFLYVLSGWEGSAHDSKVLDDAVSRTNGLKVPEDDESDDEENDDEPGNQTQEQQRQIANAWRAGIATNMWTDAVNDRIQR
ncbi:unnamed protein product [Malus baccata var. baccata]